MTLSPDFADILRAFAEADVHYLLVGGYAVSFHARPRFTKDLDLWVEDSVENLSRVERALVAFGAPASVLQAVRDAKGLDVAWMGNPPVRIDLMKQVPGAEFSGAWSRRSETDWDGVHVTIVSAPDLMELKRASGRPQDLEDLRVLDEVQRSAKR